MKRYQNVLVAAGILVVLGLSGSTSINAQQSKLQLNDVSWLWPVPDSIASLEKTISMGSLNQANGQPVWLDAQFQSILDVVDSGATEVGGSEVDFESGFSSKANWRVAGMRIDPTAPGAHATLLANHGSSVQVRLIIQPVTIAGSKVTIHDTAVHLVYSFVLNPSEQIKIPDNEKFKDILDDIRWLKAICRAGGVTTNDLPLGVHPGLDANVPGLVDEVKRFLGKHLTPKNLTAMALMGIENGAEPWIFLALAPNSDGVFGPIPLDAPFAKPQMIDFRSSPGLVSPRPIVNNRPDENTAKNVGVATDVLFGIDSGKLRSFATIGEDENGDIKDTQVRNIDIPDVIANPNFSNFFNTDCASCHTESQRRSTLDLPFGDFAFKFEGKSPSRSAEVSSSAKWNVRNFGWFPNFFSRGTAVPTATQRTANETAEVLGFIEEHFGR